MGEARRRGMVLARGVGRVEADILYDARRRHAKVTRAEVAALVQLELERTPERQPDPLHKAAQSLLVQRAQAESRAAYYRRKRTLELMAAGVDPGLR